MFWKRKKNTRKREKEREKITGVKRIVTNRENQNFHLIPCSSSYYKSESLPIESHVIIIRIDIDRCLGKEKRSTINRLFWVLDSTTWWFNQNLFQQPIAWFGFICYWLFKSINLIIGTLRSLPIVNFNILDFFVFFRLYNKWQARKLNAIDCLLFYFVTDICKLIFFFNKWTLYFLKVNQINCNIDFDGDCG